MKNSVVFFLLALVFLGCSSEKPEITTDYPDQMGEIAFNSELDDHDFTLCNENDLVHSRVSLSYEGGRARILNFCQEIFEKEATDFDYTGYVMVHFLVNCKGESGRFRIEAMDAAFVKQDAPEALIALIGKAVKSLDQWTITRAANEEKDHSKYLNFKFINGQIDGITH